MKTPKKDLGILLLIILLILTACEGKQDVTSSTMKVEKVSQTETESTTVQETIKMVVKDTEGVSSDVFVNEESSEEVVDDFQNVSPGESIYLSFTEIYLDRVSIDEEVFPRDTSGVYMYLPAIEGKKYFQLIGSLKNTFTTMYEIDNTMVQFIFDDTYEYTGFLKADAGVFKAFDYQVDPFVTVDIHIIGEIPDELINGFSKCTIELGFAENFEKVQNLDSCDYKYKIEYKRTKTPPAG